jgi:hypothetical protein
MQLKRAGAEQRMNLKGSVVKPTGSRRVGVVPMIARGFHLVPISL